MRNLSSQTRDGTHVPCIGWRILNHRAPGKSQHHYLTLPFVGCLDIFTRNGKPPLGDWDEQEVDSFKWQKHDWERGGGNRTRAWIPWRRAWQPAPVVLPGESHGQRSLVDYSPRGRRVRDDLATKPPPHDTFTTLLLWQNSFKKEDKLKLRIF